MNDAPRVVLAPDKFKGSLTAPEVAAALAGGIARVVPGAVIRQVPVADGGDGTVDAFVAAGWERVEVRAPGPTGVVGPASYARQGDTAVVELAAVVGLVKLPGGQLDPLHSGTHGLGVVIGHALDAGARHIVIGLGGSASTDGGVGMLTALGARVFDAQGHELPSGGAALADAATLDRTGLHPAVATTRFTLACDVDNPCWAPPARSPFTRPKRARTSPSARLSKRPLPTGLASPDPNTPTCPAPERRAAPPSEHSPS